jgi:hypothetical protein
MIRVMSPSYRPTFPLPLVVYLHLFLYFARGLLGSGASHTFRQSGRARERYNVARELCRVMLIAAIAASAKTLGQTKRLRSLHDLDEAALALAEVCSMLLDNTHTDDKVRAAVFTRIPVEQIPQAITTTYDLARPPQAEYQEERPIAARSPRVLLGDSAVLRRASTPWLALAASARACGRSRP